MRSFRPLLPGLLFLAAVVALHAEEAPWARTLTPLERPAALFPPLNGVGRYTFGWSGVVAAKGELRFGPARPGVLRMDLAVRTVGGVRSLWRLDAEALSEVDAATFRPLRVRQWEKYRSRNVITALQFEPGAVLYSKGRVKERPGNPFFDETGQKTPIDKEWLRGYTGERVKKLKFPTMLDCHGALLWVRQQPLRPGDRFELVIFQETAAYLAHVRVKKRETITVRGVPRAAIPVEIALEWIDKEWKLQPHGRFSKATGWYSDDTERVPLKLEAEVFVGRIWAELEHFGAP